MGYLPRYMENLYSHGIPQIAVLTNDPTSAGLPMPPVAVPAVCGAAG